MLAIVGRTRRGHMQRMNIPLGKLADGDTRPVQVPVHHADVGGLLRHVILVERGRDDVMGCDLSVAVALDE